MYITYTVAHTRQLLIYTCNFRLFWNEDGCGVRLQCLLIHARIYTCFIGMILYAGWVPRPFSGNVTFENLSKMSFFGGSCRDEGIEHCRKTTLIISVIVYMYFFYVQMIATFILVFLIKQPPKILSTRCGCMSFLWWDSYNCYS